MQKNITLLLLLSVVINASEPMIMSVYDIKQKYKTGKFVTYEEYLFLKSKQEQIKAENEAKKKAIIARIKEINSKKTDDNLTTCEKNIKPIKKTVTNSEQNTTTIDHKIVDVPIKKNTKKISSFQYGKKISTKKDKEVLETNVKTDTKITPPYLKKQIVSNDTNELIIQALQAKDYSDWMAQNIIHSIEINPKFSRAIDIQMVHEDFNAGMNEQKLKELQAALLSL